MSPSIYSRLGFPQQLLVKYCHFSEWKCYMFFVRCVPLQNTLKVCWCYYKWYCFLNFISYLSVANIIKNRIDFRMLSKVRVTLVNSRIGSCKFEDFLRFFSHEIMWKMALAPHRFQSLYLIFVFPVYVFITLGSRHRVEGTAGHPCKRLPPAIATPTLWWHTSPVLPDQSGTFIHHTFKPYCDECHQGLCRKGKGSVPSRTHQRQHVRPRLPLPPVSVSLCLCLCIKLHVLEPGYRSVSWQVIKVRLFWDKCRWMGLIGLGRMTGLANHDIFHKSNEWWKWENIYTK